MTFENLFQLKLSADMPPFYPWWTERSFKP